MHPWLIGGIAGSLAICAFPISSPARGGAPDADWARIDAVAREAVAAGNVPGVVLVVGHGGRVVYRKAFGSRRVLPEREPMTLDTVFDLASLSKVVGTTSAVMVLLQEGRIRLRDPVATHWPEFGKNGKERVTIRQLLTHTSGLAAGSNFYGRLADTAGPPVQNRGAEVLEILAGLPLIHPADTRLVYSDLGFMTLGEVVRRVSGQPLDEFARERIFRPLRMKETTYNPSGRLRERAAPTEMRGGRFLLGEVHDPSAAVAGGVAGHAGLFGTADDLTRFARMMLSSDNDAARPRYPLSPYTIREATTPHTPPGVPLRGLGWDIDSPFSHVRGDLMPLGSFGHTGFTGTYIWFDPYSETFIIGLSNRVHPDGKGNPLGMWARIANIVAGTVRPRAMPPRPAVVQARPAI